MALKVGQSLEEGIARTVSRNGLLLAVFYVVLVGLNLLTYNAIARRIVPDTSQDPTGTIGPALPVSLLGAVAISIVLYLVSFVVLAAALRTFVTDETGTIPGEYLTRNLGWLLVNYVVGYVVFLVALWVGFVLLFVPGLFLLISLYFWFVVVAVDDENFVGAFRRSWSLARGNRWSLLALGLIVTAVAAVGYGVIVAVFLTGGGSLALVLYAIFGGVFGVFSLATTARAYVQLAEDHGSTSPART